MCSENGCEVMEVESNDYRIVDEATGIYLIGREEHPLTSSTTSGIFKYLKTGGARFIKIIVIDVELLDFLKGDFLEVWDIYLVAIISRGSCKF